MLFQQTFLGAPKLDIPKISISMSKLTEINPCYLKYFKRGGTEKMGGETKILKRGKLG